MELISVGAQKQEKTEEFNFRGLFRTPRQIFYIVFFILYGAIDIANMGLVSQQIHNHPRSMDSWPTGKYQHAMGLLLCATIIGLLIAIFHYWLNIVMLMFFLLVSVPSPS